MKDNDIMSLNSIVSSYSGPKYFLLSNTNEKPVRPRSVSIKDAEDIADDDAMWARLILSLQSQWLGTPEEEVVDGSRK